MNATLPQPKKKTTLDDLAAMMKRQFDFMEKRFDAIEEKMATKEDIARFEWRFEKIEEIVLHDHRPRIRNLEKEIRI
jgi:hypothetical protein